MDPFGDLYWSFRPLNTLLARQPVLWFYRHLTKQNIGVASDCILVRNMLASSYGEAIAFVAWCCQVAFLGFDEIYCEVEGAVAANGTAGSSEGVLYERIQGIGRHVRNVGAKNVFKYQTIFCI